MWGVAAGDNQVGCTAYGLLVVLAVGLRQQPKQWHDEDLDQGPGDQGDYRCHIKDGAWSRGDPMEAEYAAERLDQDILGAQNGADDAVSIVRVTKHARSIADEPASRGFSLPATDRSTAKDT